MVLQIFEHGFEFFIVIAREEQGGFSVEVRDPGVLSNSVLDLHLGEAVVFADPLLDGGWVAHPD